MSSVSFTTRLVQPITESLRFPTWQHPRTTATDDTRNGGIGLDILFLLVCGELVGERVAGLYERGEQHYIGEHERVFHLADRTSVSSGVVYARQIGCCRD